MLRQRFRRRTIREVISRRWHAEGSKIPSLKRRGDQWTIRVWQDAIIDGVPIRKQKRVNLGPATLPFRTAQKKAQDEVAPANQGLVAVGSGATFGDFVRQDYLPGELPGFASTTQASYQAMLNKYLLPTFRK